MFVERRESSEDNPITVKRIVIWSEGDRRGRKRDKSLDGKENEDNTGKLEKEEKNLENIF